MARAEDIDIEELERLLEGGARLIDVRESDEYLSGHVPGAESFPLSTLENSFASIGPIGELVLICRSGGRSSNACDFLSEKGFTSINVSGGTMAWAMSGRDLVEGASPK